MNGVPWGIGNYHMMTHSKETTSQNFYTTHTIIRFCLRFSKIRGEFSHYNTVLILSGIDKIASYFIVQTRKIIVKKKYGGENMKTAWLAW